MAVELDIAKQHLRVTHSEEDGVIALYLQAAQSHAAQHLNRNIYDDEAALLAGILAGDLTGIVSNGAIDAAVLLICGTLYSNREQEATGTISTELKFGAHQLLQPYRIGLGV